MTKRGKVQREHFNYFYDLMKQIEWDLHQEVLDAKRIPAAWHEIANAKGQAKKVRLTIRIDADVVRFFRRFGRGYQSRMNDVLAAWMHGRLAGLIDGHCQTNSA
ncbi:BrnA antitoxin family protein [Marimonas sp. MJW-29]|uniref:BrnA antitoxin family protein n=1 Tax=Sulfitobacter sediminis TaxID=3234186 RepID=A0ABV3RNC8_9RHOB